MVCGCGVCFRVVVAAGYGFVTCCVFGCGSGFLMFVFVGVFPAVGLGVLVTSVGEFA